MSRQPQLKEVYHGRVYPMTLENEQLLLVRKNSGFKLIYEVHLKATNEVIGTCRVMEKVNCKVKSKDKTKGSEFKPENEKFVVCEYVAKSNKLKRRLEDIQRLIRARF